MDFFKISVIHFGFVEEDLVNPVCCNLLRFPRWCFLKELVDLAVQLVQRIRQDREAAGRTLPYYPWNRRFQSQLSHGFKQFSGQNVDTSPFNIFRILIQLLVRNFRWMNINTTHLEFHHEPRKTLESLSSNLFMLRTQAKNELCDMTLLH